MLLVDSREHHQRGMTMAGSLLKLNSRREAAAGIDRPIEGKPPQDHGVRRPTLVGTEQPSEFIRLKTSASPI
jgi:hypothetical protein